MGCKWDDDCSKVTSQAVILRANWSLMLQYPSNTSKSDKMSQAPDSCPPSFALAFWDQPKNCKRSLEKPPPQDSSRANLLGDQAKKKVPTSATMFLGQQTLQADCRLHQVISNSAKSFTLRCRSGQIFPDGPTKHVS